MATFKFDRVRVAVKNYLVRNNRFDLTLNLAHLLNAVGPRSAHVVITSVPEQVTNTKDVMNWRAISLWANRVLSDDGLLVFCGTTDCLPASTYIKEFDFNTSTRVIVNGETLNVFVFQKPSKWLGGMQKRRINASGFKSLESLIAGVSRPGELVIDPFQQELCIADAVAEVGCAFIGANATLSDALSKSMVVIPCSK